MVVGQVVTLMRLPSTETRSMFALDPSMRWPLPVIAASLIAGVAVAAGRARRPADARRLQRPLALRRRAGLRGVRGGRPASSRAPRRHRPELYERLRREGDDTPADVLVTTDLANLWRAEDAGLLQPVDHADARGERRPSAARPGRRLVGAHHPPARPRWSTERVARRRGHELRGPRRPAVPRPALPAHVEQRVQPVARRRHDRQARRAEHRGAAASRGWPTTRRSSTPTASCSR